jgi:bifunctional non-homologous end joining protein LigD
VADVPCTVPFPAPLPATRDPGRGDTWWLELGGTPVRLRNLDKVFWGAEGYTKADLCAYYYNAADDVLPYVADRPLTRKRMPDGADGFSFYEKQAPGHTPEWVRTAAVTHRASGETVDYVVCDDTATLLWLANLGCIELHPWHSRLDAIGLPDYAVFDLDPFDVGFDTVVEVAFLVRTGLERLGVTGYPRTSGATGLQVYVPLSRSHSHATVREWVRRVCGYIKRADPQRTTMEWAVGDRAGKVFLDHNMNTEGKNIAATFSLRPERQAPVATPVTWDELADGARPTDFTIATVWDRRARDVETFAPVLAGGQELTKAMRALGMEPDPAEDADAAAHTVADHTVQTASDTPLGEYARRRDFSRTPEHGLPAAPAAVSPMLATEAQAAFDDPDWLFEPKWDGVRTVAAVSRPRSEAHDAAAEETGKETGGETGGTTRLVSRAGNDISEAYPELAGCWERVLARTAVLDGELIAFDDSGRPSFQALQHRMHARGERAVARASRSSPVSYLVFDLLALDGDDLTDWPLRDRLARLDQVLAPGGAVQRSETVAEHGVALYEAVEQRGLEGIVAKRAASPYTPGKRSRDWRKVKLRREGDVVIVGATPGQGARAATFGSLLLGAYEGTDLVYVGRVGTCFSDAELEALTTKLAELQTEGPSLTEAPADVPADARWVEPVLVCAVGYTELTEDRRLRAPTYQGLRPQADPSTCCLDALRPS